MIAKPVNPNASGASFPCLRIQPECKRNQYFMRIVGKPNLPELDLLLEQTQKNPFTQSVISFYLINSKTIFKILYFDFAFTSIKKTKFK